MSLGVIMYGPPAAGKDTVTAALVARDSKYRQFRRLKVGQGRTAGYRMATSDDVARLRASNGIVWENTRYNAKYYVDRQSLARELSEAWPVLHLGQIPAVSAIKEEFRDTDWLVVYLWCPREIAEQRVIARETGDTEARMAAWDATESIADALFIDTAAASPVEAAALIDATVRHWEASARKGPPE